MKLKKAMLIKTLKFFDAFVVEMLIVFSFLFLINNYLGNNDVTIKSDGIGYYDYLPSLFIRGDFYRKDVSFKANSSFYKRLNTQGVFVEYKDRILDKYPIGTAILQSPFFLFTKATAHFDSFENHGYQKPFQRTVFHAAIAYLFLSLLFFKRFLLFYEVKRWSIIIGQILMVFATSTMHYASYDSSYSHIYSLFAITLFLYLAKNYFNAPNLKRFLWLCFSVGLIILIRQVNVVVVVLIPFLAGSWTNLKNGLSFTLQSYQPWLFGILTGIVTISPQLLAWYCQTGDWLIYAYQGESFNFREPHIFLMLFSYQKGLFVYAPVLFLSILGLVVWALKKQWYSFFTYVLFFLFITYVFSSWWTWAYGYSYGSRVYVDFYALLFLPLVIALNKLKWYLRIPVIGLAISCIPLAVVQSLQYKNFILHWGEMNEKGFWEVFFQTEDTYRGLLWKKKMDTSSAKIVVDTNLRTVISKPNTTQLLFQDSLLFNASSDSIGFLKVTLSNEFNSTSKNYFVAVAEDLITKQTVYYLNVPLIHFREKGLNKFHRGQYVYEIPLPKESSRLKFSLLLEAADRTKLEATNVELSILEKLK